MNTDLTDAEINGINRNMEYGMKRYINSLLSDRYNKGKEEGYNDGIYSMLESQEGYIPTKKRKKIPDN